MRSPGCSLSTSLLRWRPIAGVIGRRPSSPPLNQPAREVARGFQDEQAVSPRRAHTCASPPEPRHGKFAPTEAGGDKYGTRDRGVAEVDPR